MKKLLGLAFILLLSSCENKYEQQLLGRYKIYEYSLSGTNFIDTNNCELNLLDDNTFIIKFDSIIVRGSWIADNDGDMPWIEFHGDKHDTQCTGGIIHGKDVETISLLNPSKILIPDLKKLSFIRTPTKP